jgi:imidazolonepropionase-like amidohydrolase
MVKLFKSICLLSGFALAFIAHASVTAETILIKNAMVHTLGAQGSLAKADILIADGKIATVGTDIPATDGVLVIDATGKQVSPGIFNVHTQMGVREIGAIPSTRDAATSEKSVSVEFSPVLAFNPDSSLIAVNRTNGLTHAMIVPSVSKSMFDGLGSMVNLSGSMTESVVAKDNAIYMNYGADSASIGGGSRALTLQMIHKIFDDLASYSEKPEKSEKSDDSKEAKDSKDFKPTSSMKTKQLDRLLPMYKGEMPLVVDVDRASDIKAILDLQKQHGFKLILSSAKESWRLAEQIAEQNVAVILNPFDNLPSGFDTIANRIDAAAILAKAGVDIIFTNNESHYAHVVRNAAGNAVAYGLDWQTALKAVTSTPANWFGVGDSLGTIEAGKQADLVIWDGDPLEVTSLPEAVFIAGKAMPMVSRQTRLRDRYLKDLQDGSNPPAYNK